MSFQIGDKCELIYCIFPENAHYVGMTCVVESELMLVYSPRMDAANWAHWCVFEDGTKNLALPNQLRKIDPDCNQLTSWQECLWRPKEIA